MRIFRILFLLSLKEVSEGSIESLKTREKSPLSVAISNVCLDLFAQEFSNIRMVPSMTSDRRNETLELISDVVEQLDSQVKVTIEDISVVVTSSSKRGSPMLVFINSFEGFMKMRPKLYFDNMRFRRYFLIVMVDGIIPEIEIVVQEFWSHWISNIIWMSGNVNGTIELHTFNPFDQSCGKNVQFKLLNTFDSLTRKWLSANFYVDKFKNLNRCPLRVAAQSTAFPSVFIETFENKSSFSGIEIEIFERIAEQFNATCQFFAFDSVGSIYENGSTSSGALPSVFKREHDAAIGTVSLQYDRVKVLTETKSFLSVPIVMIIPAAEVISAFNKLIRPLSGYVWLLLSLTFLVGFVAILVLKMFSRNYYNFVVGTGVSSPLLNMAIAFFGGTQPRLPKRNFARFLLMNFLLFCLVIRCVFQGKLYNMLQMDLYEKEVSTIDDMLDHDMFFYVYETMAKRVQGFKFTDR